ncbi:MAG: hypothetical protein ACE5KK_02570 [Candidatus Brocadiales bacterium]
MREEKRGLKKERRGPRYLIENFVVRFSNGILFFEGHLITGGETNA